MTLEASEFIRRFLLHVLPDRFVKIRHFGLLANRKRRENIALCREMLGGHAVEVKNEELPETWQERLLKVSGVDVTKCPVCQKGGAGSRYRSRSDVMALHLDIDEEQEHNNDC